MLTDRNSTFKLSGSYVRPAYPGFIVINTPHPGLRLMLRSLKKNVVSPRSLATLIVNNC